jgi:deazaflavin-dependent oxidoreductase (nitroreductase family)
MSEMPDLMEFNRPIIEEFRANGGRVGGMFQGSPMLILTTVGRKSGRENVSPLVYLPDGDRYVVFGSKAGADTHPAWYYNLLANPRVKVEVGAESFEADARVTDGEERQRLFDAQVARFPAFAQYQEKTARRIPVIVLERVK